MEAASQRVLERLHAQAPEAVEAFRFFPDGGPKRGSLTRFQGLILEVIDLLGDDAFSMKIFHKITELKSRAPNWGAFWVAMQRLQVDGLISMESRPLNGRPRGFAKITRRGERALALARSAAPVPEKLGDLA